MKPSDRKCKGSCDEAAFWRFERARRQKFGRKHCLHPAASGTTCKGRIVRAHTVQRNGSLSRIAREAHVYRMASDSTTLQSSGGRFSARLVGIRKASTFTGLCARHDDETFALIEKTRFASTVAQCGLLAYRPILRELHTKRAAVATLPTLRSFVTTKPDDERPGLLRFVERLGAGYVVGLQAITAHKERFDKLLFEGPLDALRYAVIKFRATPDIMVSSGWFPTSDFDGNELPNLRRLGRLDTIPDLITFSIIGTDDGGACVLCWESESDDTCNQFVASLIGQGVDRLSDALVRLAFQTSENVYMCPQWWERRTEEEKNHLVERAMSASHPGVTFDSQDLVDDGQRLADWIPTRILLRVTSHGSVVELAEEYSQSTG